MVRCLRLGTVFALACGLWPGAVFGAETTVTVGSTGEVLVEASFAPLSDVLERFSKQTGALLSWDGAPPRQIVSLRIQAPNAAAALAAILEGQALNYAVALDATGSRVASLIVGVQPPPGAPAPAAAGARPPASDRSRRPEAVRPRDLEPEPPPSDPEPEEARTEEEARADAPPKLEPSPAPPPGPIGPLAPTNVQRFPSSPFAPQGPPVFVQQPGATPTPAPSPRPSPTPQG